MYANILLPELSSERLLVWLYHIHPVAEAEHLTAMNIADLGGEAGATALAAADGGRLGVVAVEEFVVGVPDVEHEAATWQRLLDPLTPDQPNRWRPANGPAVRLITADHRHVARMVLHVRDVEVAQGDVGVRQAFRAPRLGDRLHRVVTHTQRATLTRSWTIGEAHHVGNHVARRPEGWAEADRRPRIAAVAAGMTWAGGRMP